MKYSTRRSRQHHNPQQGEKSKQPFFSSTNDTVVQSKEDTAFFQPKLTIGQPNDKYEQEADAMADAVVNQSAQPVSVQQKKQLDIQRRYATTEEEASFGTATERMEEDAKIQEKPEVQMMEEEESVQAKIQRMEVPEEEVAQNKLQRMEEEEEMMQTKSEGGKTTANANLSNRIKQSAGKGQKMPSKTQNEMEQSFGVDFGGVNIHTDKESVQMNKSLNAQAFTHGKDVYFNQGKYNPESSGGKHLLAHELTHVVQQEGNISLKIQRKPDTVENVNVTKEEDKKKATEIIARIKANYGIDVDSQAGVDAIKKDYSSVPKSVLNNLKTKKWELKELVALEKALVHFAPILGGNRKDSSRKDDDQEITSVSAVEQGINEDEATGVLDKETMGEYFEDSRNFSMFKAGTDSTQDFADNDKQLEGTAIHEIAHGLLEYALPDFVSTFDYWLDEDTKSGKKDVEAPITKYGMESAAEDFSEAAMFFFMNPKKLKDGKGKTKGEAGNPCPERFAFMEKIVAAWKPKKKSP